jgi:uncharacterized protein (UPF0548 family)
VITVRRPSALKIEQYRTERVGMAATCSPTTEPPAGFRHESFRRVVGRGAGPFDKARTGLRRWAAHRGSGVEVFPADADLAPSSTVALLTCQLGLWVLAACRIEALVDEPSNFSFVYTTLPDHPECGYESFAIRLDGDDVSFEIDAVSRPGIPLVRIAAPVTHRLQRNASIAYLTAMEAWVQGGPDQP